MVSSDLGPAWALLIDTFPKLSGICNAKTYFLYFISWIRRWLRTTDLFCTWLYSSLWPHCRKNKMITISLSENPFRKVYCVVTPKNDSPFCHYSKTTCTYNALNRHWGRSSVTSMIWSNLKSVSITFYGHLKTFKLLSLFDTNRWFKIY